ncbi:hypothetical protein RJT34_15918 [Clitoria ternatea]|uniref:Uncharacterized protein n=1 Tax=Clitoria ternatea TaxID=43366 RepID=A0AAN9PD54_CLITE
MRVWIVSRKPSWTWIIHQARGLAKHLILVKVLQSHLLKKPMGKRKYEEHKGEKKKAVLVNLRKSQLFSSRIDAYNLLNLGSFCPKFTWRGLLISLTGRNFERLDSVLANLIWRTRFPETILQILTRVQFFIITPSTFI